MPISCTLSTSLPKRDRPSKKRQIFLRDRDVWCGELPVVLSRPAAALDGHAPPLNTFFSSLPSFHICHLNHILPPRLSLALAYMWLIRPKKLEALFSPDCVDLPANSPRAEFNPALIFQPFGSLYIVAFMPCLLFLHRLPHPLS